MKWDDLPRHDERRAESRMPTWQWVFLVLALVYVVLFVHGTPAHIWGGIIAVILGINAGVAWRRKRG